MRASRKAATTLLIDQLRYRFVILAKAGIHFDLALEDHNGLTSFAVEKRLGFRRNDDQKTKLFETA